MAQAAATARQVAAAALKDSIRVLSKYKDTPNPNRRLLQNKLDKALADRQELIQRHYIHAEKAGLDLDDENEINWLATRIDAADIVCDDVTIIIKVIEEAAEELQRNTEKAHFESKEKADIQLSNLQCAIEEKSIKDCVRLMGWWILLGTTHEKARKMHSMYVHISHR